jgi:hypothetical protein
MAYVIKNITLVNLAHPSVQQSLLTSVIQHVGQIWDRDRLKKLNNCKAHVIFFCILKIEYGNRKLCRKGHQSEPQTLETLWKVGHHNLYELWKVGHHNLYE